MKTRTLALVVLVAIVTFGAGAAVGVLVTADASGGLPTTPPQDAQGRYVITITRDHAFVPAAAIVPAGTALVWVNEGSSAHDVNALDGGFSSDRALGAKLRQGDAFEIVTEQGVHRYECELHSAHMKGMLIVEA